MPGVVDTVESAGVVLSLSEALYVGADGGAGAPRPPQPLPNGLLARRISDRPEAWKNRSTPVSDRLRKGPVRALILNRVASGSPIDSRLRVELFPACYVMSVLAARKLLARY